MERRATVLTLLSLSVLASGCLHGGGGNGTSTEGPESVEIQELSVTPPQINSGQSVRASLTATNAGSLPAVVETGDKGEEVLVDYCTDIFENIDSSYSASSTIETQTKREYRLEPGQKLYMNWELGQIGDVPLYGKKCNLEFSVPFNYSVEAYRQVQIKREREVAGSAALRSESSKGPMVMAIDTLSGPTGQPSTYIAEEGGSISIMVELINQNPEEDFTKGLIDINEKSLFIRASGPLELDEGFEMEDGELNWNVKGSYDDPRCSVPGREITLNLGRSLTINCDVPVPGEDEISGPANLSRITAGVNYTYIKDAGTRTVRVEPRG